MNLVKVAELLKNAPDQSLMQELSNPSGSAPSYMVLAELERRKKVRSAYQMEQGAQPASSVAEDAQQEYLAQTAPAMGIGSMPQAQQFSDTAPQGFAAGGVVGYADGGDVGSFEDYQQAMGAQPPNIFQRVFGYSSDVENQRKRQELMAQGLTRAQADAVIAGGKAPAPTPPTPAAGPTSNAGISAVAPPQPPRAAPAPSTGIASVPPAAPASKGEYTVNPLLDELKGYRKELSEAYKNQADMYKQQSEEIKKSKDSDIAMALMTAGLGIMGGRSQYAAENIGQGALPAIQQYAGMDRARREQLQKMALGQGALGIEQLGAQMKGVAAEGELGLGGEKMDIARRSADADMLRARAAAAGVANQASQWKQDNAQERVNQQRANSLINYLKTEGINLDEGTKAQYVAEINRLLGVSGTMSGIPQGVTVSRIKP